MTVDAPIMTRREARAAAPSSPSVLIDSLEELAALVEDAKPVFLSSDIRVDRQMALELIEDLRREMPAAVAQADEMLRAAQTEREAARIEAEEIISAARDRALDLVEQEQVVAQANARAADIVNAADAQAETLKANADEYCDGRLAALGEDVAGLHATIVEALNTQHEKIAADVEAVHGQVAAGRARLAERLVPDASRPRWDSPADPQWPAAA
ncbi:MAG: hypothetical protein LBH13_05400 [Cellulomonadaceae bacterium]|jgi:argininosuccinate lyase|nr:hypothetical protein [Cellulomonadaceae bacterium]